MNRKNPGICILLIILLSTIPTSPKKWMVYADGALDPEQVWIEFRETDWTGQGIDTDAQSSLDDNYFAGYIDTEFNFTVLDVDTVNITQLRTYVEWDGTNDAFSRDWRAAVHNYTAIDDGGDRIAFEDWELQNLDGTPAQDGWVTRVLTTEWELEARAYFIGFGCEDQAGAVRMYRQTNGAAGSGSIFDNAGWEGSDPFNEWANWNTEEWNIQIKYEGYKEELTETNTFTGNATHYIGRRDLNHTFPAGVDDEQILMSFPAAEQILNITAYNGGAWDITLAEADYTVTELNGTHDVLTIIEATINTYGGIYRVFTSTYSYYYDIGGAFFENGTNYGAVNISATYEGGSTTIEVNGSTIIGQDTEIILFQWDVGDAVRFYYTRDSQEQFNIYFPDDDYATYEFQIRDLSGDLQAHNAESHLESLRYINNSLDVVERVAIADVVNDVPLTLVTYQVYRLRILHPDEHIVNFGIQVTGVITDPTLIIDDIEFSAQAQITYRYLTVEVTRPSATQITVNYNDSLADTDSLSIYLEYRNGTDVYNETVVEDNYQFNYLGADAWTDYEVTVVITHGTFGTRTHREIIGVQRTFNPFPDVSMVGSVGPISTGNILSLFIVFAIALAFSAVNAEIAGFVAVSVAYILRYWNVNDFSYGTLSICMAIVIGYAIVRRAT